MKKLFLSIMLCAGFGLLEAEYTPSAGPLTLGDSGRGAVRGVIMKAIVDNDPAIAASNPKLAAANMALSAFDGRGQNFRTYQEIMQNIKQATNTQAALNAARAIETVIMHRYDYDTYMIGGYRPTQSIFISGVRYWNFFSDDAILQQLINELDQLADIVGYHSIASSIRLKTTVHSYRHWRRNMLMSIAAYLAADTYKHGYQNSLIHQFHQRGLQNAPDMVDNHASNIRDGIYGAGHAVCIGAQGAWNYVLKPLGQYCYGGAQAFDGQQQQEQAEQEEPKGKLMDKIKTWFKSSDYNLDHDNVKKDNAFEKKDNAYEKKTFRNLFAFSGAVMAAKLDKLAHSATTEEYEKRKAIWNKRLKRMGQVFSGPSLQKPSDQEKAKQKLQVREKFRNHADSEKAKQKLQVREKFRDCMYETKSQALGLGAIAGGIAAVAYGLKFW